MTEEDRTGWCYRSRRRRRVWRVFRGSRWGWHLSPEWTVPGTAGGVKGITRTSEDLDDLKKWERVADPWRIH